MLNQIENEIVALFLRSPTESYTVYGIAKILNRYVSQVQRAIMNLNKYRIIDVKKLGRRTSRCHIKFATADVDALACASIHAKKAFLDKNLKLRLISNEVEKKLGDQLYVMVLFGSCAKGEQKIKSDIDLCFLVQSEDEAFRSKAKAILGGFSYKIHINVFAAKWFYDMLNQRDTVGREILKSSVVLHGHDLYYSMVKKYDQETGYSEGYTAL